MWDFVSPLLRVFASVLEWLLRRVRGQRLPTQTLRVVAAPEREFRWHSASKVGSVPLMDVRGSFYLTNITNNVDVIITRTFLVAYFCKRWLPHRVRVDGYPAISDGRGYEGMWSSRYNIPRGETREAHAN